MQVNFSGSTSVTGVKLPPLKPVEDSSVQRSDNQQTPKNKFSTLELWKDTLKLKANVDAYSNGFFKGVKYSLVAGAGLVGIDWLVYSTLGVGKGRITAGEMLKTPFKTVGKAIATGWKFIFGTKEAKSIFTRPLGNTIKRILKSPIDLYKTIYHAKKSLSPVSRYGLPILIAGVAAYTTFRSYLNANKEKADVDHRYGGRVGHH